MIVGIKFGENSKVYYFKENGFNLSEGDNVIVDTEKGSQYGTVVSLSIEENKKMDYKNVLKIANKNDYKKHMNKNLHLRHYLFCLHPFQYLQYLQMM